MSKSGCSAHASMVARYRSLSHLRPNKMLALIVSFSTNACCGTYAHRPYTSTVPAVQAISESNALHNDDFPEPTYRTKVSGWWELGLGLGTGEVNIPCLRQPSAGPCSAERTHHAAEMRPLVTVNQPHPGCQPP